MVVMVGPRRGAGRIRRSRRSDSKKLTKKMSSSRSYNGRSGAVATARTC